MKIKKSKQHVFFLLLLPLCVVVLGAGCENEEFSLKQSINGSWKVSKQIISGELESIVIHPENANYTDILIVIPDTLKGYINGNTFRNSIWVDFEIKEKQQIKFKNYGGTRIVEDDWGASFRENLLNSVRFSLSNDELFFIDSLNQTVIVFIKN